MNRLIIYTVWGLLLCTLPARAQDLEKLKGQKPVTLSGSIGTGANFYTSNEAYKTRDPFSWNLYGNLTARIYGIDLPFSFVVNQYSRSYSAPFSQFGISPTYKWATLHLGYRNISLSPLVFDGQSFLGAGLELRPGKWELAGFYGRLNKAISEDTTYDHRIEPQYSRIGYGVKIGYGKEDRRISLHFFHAKDDEGSIPLISDSLNTLMPRENTVLGSSWTLRFLNVMSFNGNLAVSLLNRDMRYGVLDSIGNYEVPKFIRSLSPVNESTVFSYSGRAQLALNLQKFNALAGYQRIQPDYISLGTPYTINDVETISGNMGGSLFRSHLSINASGSAQHNNLSKALATELHARSANLSVNANVNTHWNLNLNINGAHVLQKDGQLELNDSLRMNQLMLSYSLSPSYMTSSVTRQHVVSGNISYTDLDDRNPVTATQAAGNNLNISASYSLQFLQSFKGVQTGLNYSAYGQQDYRYHSTGVHAGGNAQLLKDHQLNVQGDIGYYFNRSNGETAGNNTTFTVNSSYTVKKHSFSLYGSYIITPPIDLNPLDKVNRVPYAVRSKNLSAGVTYGYHF